MEAQNSEKNMTMQLNTLQPAAGSKKNAKRVGRGIGSGLVRPVVEVIKVKNHVQVDSLKLVLKAAKCLYNVVCLKWALPHAVLN